MDNISAEASSHARGLSLCAGLLAGLLALVVLAAWPPTSRSASIKVTTTADTYDVGNAGGTVVAHTYPAPGVYTAVVTASNSISLLTAATPVTITQPGDFSLHLPLALRTAP
jgi:hypothetical protein